MSNINNLIIEHKGQDMVELKSLWKYLEDYAPGDANQWFYRMKVNFELVDGLDYQNEYLNSNSNSPVIHYFTVPVATMISWVGTNKDKPHLSYKQAWKNTMMTILVVQSR